MMIIDRYIAIWIAGILIGAGSITFGFWQLNMVTPIVGFNLELVTLWIDFFAVIALYNKSRAWTLNLFGCSFVPHLAAGSFGAFFNDEMLLTPAANLMGGFALLLLFPPLVIFVSVMDFLPKTSEMASVPKAA